MHDSPWTAARPSPSCRPGFDRHDDRIEIKPLDRSSRLQRRGDLRPAQPGVDPIGRNGYPFDNVQDEAFHLDAEPAAATEQKPAA